MSETSFFFRFWHMIFARSFINISLIFGVVFGFLLAPSLTVLSAQKSTGYKMPFRNTEIWSTDRDYGVHQDSVGYGFDFYAPAGSSKDVLAVSDGILTRGCTVNGSTRLRLDTGAGDIVRYFHMRADTVPISWGEDVFVRTGDILGKVTDGGNFDLAGCHMSTDSAHLHFSWPADQCPMNIQGSVFDCNDMKICYGIGVYLTTCNRKYLGQSFGSTNLALDFESNCDLIKKKSFDIGTRGLEIVRLQNCLKADGLYNFAGGVSGYYGNYSKGVHDQWKSRQTTAEPVPIDTGLDNCTKSLAQNYLIGQSNQTVRELQQCLKDKGLFNWGGGVTGYYGNYTNGVYENWLTNGDCQYFKNKSYPSGERSSRVKRLQQCLREAGVFSYPSNTGFFGPITEAAYRRW